ncbi:hypothetical protein [Lacihabitans soyangensis]|uniref:Uncharacterized protein n=1 Tax=Lacihabitans soyangensis TaxID=869394 RepID=A0AAE3KT48_9BACT|nr:hypothetical protein [Lacihabitans soyangensis]MCP9763329.1 hypothetical protein [Lacihabitans soyangensis]
MTRKYNQSKKINQSGIQKFSLVTTGRYKEVYIQKTPVVKSLSGIIKLEQDFDIKKEYSEFLIDKYK